MKRSKKGKPGPKESLLYQITYLTPFKTLLSCSISYLGKVLEQYLESN